MIRRHISSNTELALSSRLDRFSRGEGRKERYRLYLQFYLAYPHGSCHISYIDRDDRLKETINRSYQPEGMRASKIVHAICLHAAGNSARLVNCEYDKRRDAANAPHTASNPSVVHKSLVASKTESISCCRESGLLKDS